MFCVHPRLRRCAISHVSPRRMTTPLRVVICWCALSPLRYAPRDIPKTIVLTSRARIPCCSPLCPPQGFLLWVVFVDCIATGCIIASALWYICNRFLRVKSPHAVEEYVEWAYAFDVHCNAFFPLLLILHVLQIFIMVTYLFGL